MADRALAVASPRDDRGRPARLEGAPERVGVVSAVGDQALEAARDGRDRLWRDRYVAGVAGREVDDGWAAEDVRDDVDLGGRPAPRGPDALRASPPLPPCAERCALTYVESSAAVSVTQPASARAGSMARQKPRRDHLLKRL